MFGEFSGDEKYVVICGRNRVQLVQTYDGNIIWTKEFPWNIDAKQREKGWRWLNDVEVSRDGSLIAVASIAYRVAPIEGKEGATGIISEDPKIMLVNKDGEVIWEKEELTEGERALKLFPDKSGVIIEQETILKQFEFFQKEKGEENEGM